LGTPDVASLTVLEKLTRSPTVTVVLFAPAVTTGAVRSRITLPHARSERLAELAGWAWFELTELSGIAESAATAQK
jgi:hypothetical protein